MRILRWFLQTLAALIGFAAGWYLTLFLLMRLMTPSPSCDAPCDGPAYVGLGLSILVGPIVGVFTGLAAVVLVSRLIRQDVSGQA